MLWKCRSKITGLFRRLLVSRSKKPQWQEREPDTQSRSPAISSPDLRRTSQKSRRAATGSYRSAAAETSPSESPPRTSSAKGEVSPPSAAVLRAKQIKTQRELCSVVQSLVRSSRRARGPLGRVICAVRFGLQATAEERHLRAKINNKKKKAGT